MAFLGVSGSAFTTPLMEILNAPGIEPGSDVSYQLCKLLYEYHPLGAKLAEGPIKLAQSQQREIEVANGPETRVRKAFNDEFKKLGGDEQVFNLFRTARIYGIASVALVVDGDDPSKEIDFSSIWEKDIAFNTFDPLNTSGSLVLNQNPNATDFQKSRGSVTVQGQTYHRSRVVIQLNEEPIYISFTSSAFGFVGRSVYQRTLYPLKSYLQTMRADNMVAIKAGLIVAKIKSPGSVISQAMQAMAGVKRSLLREAQTDNVMQIGTDEDVAAIDLTNVNAALSASRQNILNNIAAGASMPAILVNEETFAEGFGEGTEDARHVALWIDQYRRGMDHAYAFIDNIVQRRAWNPNFFETIQKDFPGEYAGRSYEDVLFEWQDGFTVRWPSLLTEPESEKSKGDKVKLDAILAMVEKVAPMVDPDNKAEIIRWAQDNFNSLDTLFSDNLNLDLEALKDYVPPQPMMGQGGPPGQGEEDVGPAKADSATVKQLITRRR